MKNKPLRTFHFIMGRNARVSLLMCLLGLSLSASAAQAKFVTFDAPGAVYGTYATTINDRGEVAGFYVDGNFVYHGLLRSAQGVITTFDAPGASTTGYGTFSNALNDEGVLVGDYTNSDFNYGGFIRTPDGKFETYRNPKACTTGDPVGCEGTGFAAINALGVIAGGYVDNNFVQHAFLSTPRGTVTTYDAPGAGNTPGNPANISPLGDYLYQGTSVAGLSPGLNVWGAVTSSYLDENNVYHGYLRSPVGVFTDFDAPGAGKGLAQGTVPISLNDLGVITGFYLDSKNVLHGFLGNPDFGFTDLNAPGADTTDAFYGTEPASLNDLGAITGSYLDAAGVWHGFLRSPVGTYTKLDAPGADLTAGDLNGTFPEQINLLGVIAGFYTDENSVAHGFLLTPCGFGEDCQNEEQANGKVSVLPHSSSGVLSPFRRRLSIGQGRN
jgi:uncharacterized membrane protein